jgi:CRISPR-associated endonuclease/helicase Cas3
LRGYGVPSRQRALNAGMAQRDSLVVLDEAQLIPSAIHSIKTAFEYDSVKLGDVPQSRLLELTATYAGDGTLYDDLPMDDPIIVKRRSAKRNICYVTANCPFDKQAADEVKKVFEDDKIKVVAVVCNTVRGAKKTFAKLQKKYDTIMLIGRCRNYEKQKLRQQHFARLAIGRDRSKDKPLVVVATQTIEVGVNFDFDAMISQSAPVDCIIQRFGRLNREGDFDAAKGVVIHCPTWRIRFTEKKAARRSTSCRVKRNCRPWLSETSAIYLPQRTATRLFCRKW